MRGERGEGGEGVFFCEGEVEVEEEEEEEGGGRHGGRGERGWMDGWMDWEGRGKRECRCKVEEGSMVMWAENNETG